MRYMYQLSVVKVKKCFVNNSCYENRQQVNVAKDNVK